MQEFDCCGRRLNPFARKVTADWVRSEVRPNIAATFTLMQARRIQYGDTHIWVRGDENEYEWGYLKIVHGISSQHLGRAYRRYRKLIPSFATLEGDGVVKRKHIHAGFRCPDHVDQNEFIGSLYYWSGKSSWGLRDVHIEPITGDWPYYSSKDGSEALLVGSLSF